MKCLIKFNEFDNKKKKIQKFNNIECWGKCRETGSQWEARESLRLLQRVQLAQLKMDSVEGWV